MKESTHQILFLKKNFQFFCFNLKKLMLLERIFHYLRDILGILDSFKYSSSTEPVNYYFLVGFQVKKKVSWQGFFK